MSEPPRKKYKQASLLSFMQRSSSSTATTRTRSNNNNRQQSAATTSTSPSSRSLKTRTTSGKGEAETNDSETDPDIICLESPIKVTAESGQKKHCNSKTRLEINHSATSVNNISSQPVEDIMESESSANNSQVIEDSQSSFQSCLDAGENTSATIKQMEPSTSGNGMEKPVEISDSQTTTKSDLSADLFDSDSDSILMAAATEATLPKSDSATLAYSDSQQSGDSQLSDAVGTLLSDMRLFPEHDATTRVEKKSSDKHKLFIKTPTVPNVMPNPCCSAYIDIWDDNHVRMPCSDKNLYPEQGTGKLLNRWSLIENSLLSQMTSSFDIEEAILAYNSRYKGKWDFTILHRTINEIMTANERSRLFEKTLPGIVRLALSLPTLVTVGVPLLRQNVNYSLTFSQQQLASLLANAFFCTFPRRNASHRNSEYSNYPTINMNGMFALSGRNSNRDMSLVHKLKCIFQYFDKITEKAPTGCVTFRRKVLDGPTASQWESSDKKLTECLVTSTGLIEDADGAAQADFANCRIGGGVLRTGCVQEEIQFTIHPELLISRLFTEVLSPNEVMIIKGAERFCYYSGYADTFRYTGPYDDTITCDALGRRYRHILAMDATRYGNTLTQYPPDKVLREMNKAYCAFHSNKSNAVAISTGNWGCGAFRGNHYLKGMLQMMVAAQCGRQLYYSAYGDNNLKKELYAFHQFCVNRNISVGQLWKSIVEYERTVIRPIKKQNQLNVSILQFIRNRLR